MNLIQKQNPFDVLQNIHKFNVNEMIENSVKKARNIFFSLSTESVHFGILEVTMDLEDDRWLEIHVS